jgi:hypothetical protein
LKTQVVDKEGNQNSEKTIKLTEQEKWNVGKKNNSRWKPCGRID